MSDKTRQNRIINKNIKESVGVVSIIKKMVRNRLRWFGHLEIRHVDFVVSIIDQIEKSQITRIKERLKKLREIINKYLEINNFDRIMILDKTL